MDPTTYTIGETLRLTLALESPRFGLAPEDLFSLAVRDNPKRAFLFVSRVLGKHLSRPPAVLLAAGRLLALAWTGSEDGEEVRWWTDVLTERTTPLFSQVLDRRQTERIDLPPSERTLFLGFAETATGLARGVADCFGGEAGYLSTTRLHQPGDFLTFEEVHSHASTHRLYLTPDDPFVKGCTRVVLIDDELTTGNTALSLVRLLHRQFGIPRFTLLSLLDNSDGKNRQALERELGIEIQAVSLLRGRLVSVQAEPPPPPNLEDWRERAGQPLFPGDPPLSLPDGRTLLNTRDRDGILAQCRGAANRLGEGGETLFLGTGERIYEPALLAGLCGAAAFHSTTQSPVCALAGSAITSGVRFTPSDCYSAAGYLYNVPRNQYRRAVICTEQSTRDPRGLAQLAGYLSSRGIDAVEEVLL